MRTIRCAVTVGLMLFVACADGGTEAANDAQATGDTAAMPPMPGMSGAAQPGAGGMEPHLTTMMSANTDSLEGLVPTHRQMAANMIADMNKEMREMNMTGDAAWAATLDSVRADLQIMADLAPGQVKSMLPLHVGRVRRLQNLHKTMMAH